MGKFKSLLDLLSITRILLFRVLFTFYLYTYIFEISVKS